MVKGDDAEMIGRIDIQGHGFCDQEMNVNRSMPAVLSNHMVYSSWISFCDKVDEVLLPATRTKRRSLVFFVLLIFVVFAIVLVGFVATNSSSTAFMICYLTAFAALIVGPVLIWCYSSCIRQKIEAELGKICEDTSIAYPAILFTVERNKYVYIQVCINESRYVAPELDANSASEEKGLLSEDKYKENGAETLLTNV